MDSEKPVRCSETDDTTSTSDLLLEKSIHAATASIEIFNKPNFAYRHEIFTILMSNAWELLLKAKVVRDNGENVESVYATEGTKGSKTIKRSRSGNPITHSLKFLANKVEAMSHSGMEKSSKDNILELSGYRNDAVHLFVQEEEIGHRIARLGAASLRNYTFFVRTWFGRELVTRDFPFLPLAFEGPPTLRALGTQQGNEHGSQLLAHWDALEHEHREEKTDQYFSATVEVLTRRTRDPDGMPVRFSNDPDARTYQLKEEDISNRYPWTYHELTERLKSRYSNFSANQRYHDIRKSLFDNVEYCWLRKLDQRNPKSLEKRFFSPKILTEFDRHYTKKS